MAEGEKEHSAAQTVCNYINENKYVFYYGMNEEDKIHISNLFNSFVDNPESSCFPDLLINNGFIEHFEITSSKETKKKGSLHRKNFSAFKESYNEKVKKLQLETEDDIVTDEFVLWEHSYDNLILSFNKNFTKHIKSYKAYSGNAENKLFLICYDEQTVHTICEYPDKDLIQKNPHVKEIYNQEKYFYDYLLSRDTEMLSYIFNYKDNLDYICFLNSICCEVIKVESIPDIINNLQLKYLFHPAHVTTVFYDKKI